jgi:zinc/manganese transport system permease protein
MVTSVVIGLVASIIGLLLSYHASLPASPAIILVAGVLYILSLSFGRHGSLMRQALYQRAARLP